VKSKPIVPALGVELTELDLSAPLGDEARDELKRLFAAHHMLLFRNQEIAYEDQVKTVEALGPVLPGGPEWVSNVRENGLVPEGRLLFHSDFIFTPEPCLGLSLYAIEIPADGSPTVFASTVRAARELPPDLRAAVSGRSALNIFDLTDQRGDVRFHEETLGPPTPLTPRYAHPILMRHPTTGLEVLTVNEMQTDYILGVDHSTSESVLSSIREVLYAPENTYTHRWSAGDLVIWDNIAVQHGRPSPPSSSPRTLRRVTMATRDVFDLVPGFAEARAELRHSARAT
jgi:taurine dioxygenase